MISDVKHDRVSEIGVGDINYSTVSAMNISEVSNGEYTCTPVLVSKNRVHFQKTNQIHNEDHNENDEEFTKEEINSTFKSIYHDLEKLRIELIEKAKEQSNSQDEGKVYIIE